MEKAPNLINHYFDMEAYSINPSVKYQIINSPELLSKEVSPSILESKNANLIDDGKWYVNWIKDNLGQDYHDEINNDNGTESKNSSHEYEVMTNPAESNFNTSSFLIIH